MIKVFGKPSCPNCVTAKSLLQSKGVFYEYFDVSVNQDALEFVKSKGAKSVPVVFDEDEMIGGFNELKKYLETA